MRNVIFQVTGGVRDFHHQNGRIARDGRHPVEARDSTEILVQFNLKLTRWVQSYEGKRVEERTKKDRFLVVSRETRRFQIGLNQIFVESRASMRWRPFFRENPIPTIFFAEFTTPPADDLPMQHCKKIKCLLLCTVVLHSFAKKKKPFEEFIIARVWEERKIGFETQSSTRRQVKVEPSPQNYNFSSSVATCNSWSYGMLKHVLHFWR